jgi:hypothetical protein
MRVAALILGIVGGVLGLIASILAITVGGIGHAVGASNADQVTGLGFLAFACTIVGFVGAGLALAKPRMAALLLLIAGVVGFISISVFWLLSGPFLLVGALLAFLGRGSKAPVAATSPSVTSGQNPHN